MSFRLVDDDMARKLDIQLLVLDCHPPAVREQTLPEEDATPGMVGQLLRTLHETRDATLV